MSAKDIAAGIAGGFIDAGVCVEEAKNVIAAAGAYDDAFNAFDSSVGNTAAGGAADLGGVVGMAFCLLGGPEPATLGCLVVMGIGTLGGVYWTDSAIKAMEVAEHAIDTQSAALQSAWQKLCQCVHHDGH